MMFFIKKTIDAHEVKINAGQIDGVITLQAKKGGRVVREMSFHNMFTDAGLDRLAQPIENFYLCERARVGRGNSTPNPGQTSLDDDFGVWSAASVRVSLANSGTPDYTSTEVVRYSFGVGEIVGNVAEVMFSIGRVGGSTSMIAAVRELVRDEFGLPTVFPVLADEQLDVLYTLTIWPSVEDQLLTQKIGDTTYDVTVRSANVNTAVSWISGYRGPFRLPNGSQVHGSPNVMGAITGNPSGASGAYVTNASYQAYTNGDFEREMQPTWPVGSTLNIRSIWAQISPQLQWEYDTPVAKPNTHSLTIPFVYAWGRKA